MIGSRFGHFRLEEKLGQGGMGVVYRARDEKLHRMVALKFLTAKWAEDPSARARLLREARSAAALTHRNVATVYEVGEESGQVFVALELIEGRSLRAVLQAGRPPLDEALRIATGIVRGVAKAHEKGIVHRDLKPENVMLTEDGDVKVLDFGLARQVVPVDPTGPTGAPVEAVTKTGQIMGTPAYMSPEQATGQPLDVRSDVFSLGLIIYELTAGRHPFPPRSPIELAVAIVTNDPPPASSINPEITLALDRIIATCMAKAPAERYASARDLLRDLESLGKESASPPAVSSEVEPPARRSRALVAGVGLALVAIAGASVWSLRTRPNVRAGRPAAIARVDHAAPTSSNPEAVRVYLDGVKAEDEGRRKDAKAAYYRAIELDPKLAPAQLRVALSGIESNSAPVDEIRETFRRALAGRASLDEPDQARLDAWEPVMQREPIDEAETIRRLRAALQRFPNERPLAADLARLLCKSPDIAPEARIAEAKAAGLDGASLAEVVRCTNADLRQPDEAAAEKDPCEKTPGDVTCLADHFWALARDGKCVEGEAVARRMLTINPDGAPSVFALTSALLGQHGQEESVKEILRKWTAEPRMAKPRLWGEISLAIVTGDFTAAIERSRALDDLVKDLREEKDHAEAATYLATLFEEIGKPREADRAARSFLARRAAYEPTPTRDTRAIGLDPTGVLLGVERRAGTLQAAEHDAQLQARLDWWDRRLGKTSWLRYSLWQRQYAEGVENAEEAREAMAARARFGRAYKEDFGAVGRTYLLAGLAKEALPYLERDAKRCEFVFGDQLQHTRSWFFLGEARAATGDKPGACAAYAKLLERWGAAKPRSLTAEKARRRQRELHCAP